MRISPSLRILHLCLVEHLLAEIAAQVLRCAQIYFPFSEQGRQFSFHASHPEKSGCATTLELDEHVDIALRPQIRSQRRTENC
jgi:hypothetical protein